MTRTGREPAAIRIHLLHIRARHATHCAATGDNTLHVAKSTIIYLFLKFICYKPTKICGSKEVGLHTFIYLWTSL